MEVKRVKDETYESISAYLDLILTQVNRFNDLCFITFDGKIYMASHVEKGVGIVENDKGELSSYYLGSSSKAINMTEYSTNEHLYEILDEDVKEITRTEYETENRSKLVYLPAIEDHPRDVLEYVQYLEEEVIALSYRYDVTSRRGINDAILFSSYHFPDSLLLKVLKQKLFFTYQKSYHYSLGLVDGDKYYQPLIKIGEMMFGTRRTVYDAETLIDEICEYGFTKKIPEDLSSLLKGDNKKYNELKLVANAYKSYIKVQ
ncbi:MAG: hypothetical protein J1F35_02360 [Erysipelotrichales bacterium]|nr:hypothetical protein [Erysipelotrichales bacterium]